MNVSPVQGIDWTFETIKGFQNIEHKMMQFEGGTSTQIKSIYFFYGILFHSYLEKVPFVKTQMNLAFDGLSEFYWTEKPNINYEKLPLNEHLRCIELEVHCLIPKIAGNLGHFYPFVGYTFLDFSFSPSYLTSTSKKNFIFQALVLGMEYHRQYTRRITANYFLSVSPLMYTNTETPLLHYLNYGAELNIKASPIALTVFVGFKKGREILQKNLIESDYNFSNSEIGINFTISLN